MGLSQTTAKTQEGEKVKTQEPCAAEAVEDLVPESARNSICCTNATKLILLDGDHFHARLV